MKYFTPERYIALQDFSSDAVMNMADAAWDQAVEQYDAYYRSVETVLPAEFRGLQEGYYLHDALVIYLGPQGKRFVVALRLDPPPQQILQLSYELASAPRVNRDVLPATLCGKNVTSWQYDEVELVTATPLLCVHSILLSNGWEVQLPFRGLRIEEVQPLLLVPGNGSPSEEALTEAEAV